MIIFVIEERRSRKLALQASLAAPKEPKPDTNMEMAAFTAAVQPDDTSIPSLNGSVSPSRHIHLSPRKTIHVDERQFSDGSDVGTEEVQATQNC